MPVARVKTSMAPVKPLSPVGAGGQTRQDAGIWDGWTSNEADHEALAMRLPRITTRLWMIAVVLPAMAIATLACWYLIFRSLAAYHRSQTASCIAVTDQGCISLDYSRKRKTDAEAKASPCHWRVSDIYERAAARPWRPVEPIPPELE
jgi:hypothetical protein